MTFCLSLNAMAIAYLQKENSGGPHLDGMKQNSMKEACTCLGMGRKRTLRPLSCRRRCERRQAQILGAPARARRRVQSVQSAHNM